MEHSGLLKRGQALLQEYGTAAHTYVWDGKTIGILPERVDSVLMDLTDGICPDRTLLQQAAEQGLPVVVIARNAMEGAMHWIRAMETAYAGLPQCDSFHGFLTEQLDVLMEEAGFYLEKADVSIPALSTHHPELKNQPARRMDTVDDMRLLDQMSVYDEDRESRVGILAETILNGEWTAVPQLIRLYVPETARTTRPFLSVVIRTMGKRIGPLRDALLCLAAQSMDDFEIVLVGHKTGAAEEQAIHALIREQMPSLQRKIRYYRVADGGRSHPINAGLERVRGRYFSVFDDDDLLFDNWVANFHEAAEVSPCRVLHQYAVGQEWTMYERNGESYPVSISAYNNLFCADFDMLSQQSYNRCPLMSLAFPVSFYQQIGQKFNETLDVCEDWEYLMRLSNLFGVRDIAKVGAIYRIWKTDDNSHAVNSESTWRQTEKRIMDSLESTPVIMPTRWLKGYVDMDTVYKKMVKRDAYLLDTVLYTDNGSGFQETTAIHYKEHMFLGKLDLQFDMNKSFLRAVRWDPVVEGTVLLVQPEVTAVDDEGNEVHLELIHTNGIPVTTMCRLSTDEPREALFFDTMDPKMIYRVDSGKPIARIRITGLLQERFRSDELEYYRGRGWSAACQRMKNETQETLYRIKNRLKKSY